jgi:hypothetical protein
LAGTPLPRWASKNKRAINGATATETATPDCGAAVPAGATADVCASPTVKILAPATVNAIAISNGATTIAADVLTIPIRIALPAISTATARAEGSAATTAAEIAPEIASARAAKSAATAAASVAATTATATAIARGGGAAAMAAASAATKDGSGKRRLLAPDDPHPNPSPCAQGEGLFILASGLLIEITAYGLTGRRKSPESPILASRAPLPSPWAGYPLGGGWGEGRRGWGGGH